jgi:hypothetical protein
MTQMIGRKYEQCLVFSAGKPEGVTLIIGPCERAKVLATQCWKWCPSAASAMTRYMEETTDC